MPALTSLGGRHVLHLAAWAGLAAGVLEGLLAVSLQAAGWPLRVSSDLLWVAPVFDLALFAVAGGVLALACRLPVVARQGRLLLVAVLWMLTFCLAQVPDAMAPWSALVLSLGIAVAAGRGPGAIARWQRIARRTTMPLAAASLLCVGTGLAWAPLQAQRALSALPRSDTNAPNVLLVTLDTLRADHVSSLGYPRDTTPNLDRFARRGVVFTQAFANASWTLPSHASLLTGRLPHEHGADWLQPLRPEPPTIAEALTARGYATAAFAANTSYVSPQWGLGRGFGRFEVYGGSWIANAVRTAYGRRLSLNLLPRLGLFDIPGRKPAAAVNGQFLDWVDGVSGQPFFALLNYLDVHDPYVTGDPYHTKYSATPARGDVINFQFQPHAFRRKAQVSAAERQAEIDAYDGCLAYLDARLGELFAELDRRGLASKTIVVLTSDHGEAFGNHDLFGHGNSLYAETLHVPLVVVWPDHVPAAVRVDGPVGLNRIAATIDTLTDPGGRDGRFPGGSLAPLWNRPADGLTWEPIVSEVSGVVDGPAGYPTSGGALASVLTRDWHLIVPASGRPALYDWSRDPAEEHDLSATAAGQAAIPALTDALRAAGAVPSR